MGSVIDMAVLDLNRLRAVVPGTGGVRVRTSPASRDLSVGSR
ncbi:hypothetical protein [Nonomuraea sp. NPDC052265]